MRSEYTTAWLLLLFIILVLYVSCGKNPPPGEVILFDFETEEELDQSGWHCHTLMSLSREHVTHGKKALHLEIFPSTYPGFNPCIRHSDWRGFSAFSFDVFNPGRDTLELVVRIDDREDQPEYRDRVNRPVPLAPGPNTVTIPLDGLMVSGKHRKLQTGSIQAMKIFMVKPDRKVDLYLDHGRLIPIDGPQIN